MPLVYKSWLTVGPSLAGFDDEVGLADGFSERVGGHDRVKSGVRFADPVEDDAVTDRIDLPELDPPFRDVLVRKSVVVFGVNGRPDGLVVLVPDKLRDRPATDFHLKNSTTVSALGQVKSLSRVETVNT